ncbi:hypothetical protein D3C79_996560 [compost metagenome]
MPIRIPQLKKVLLYARAAKLCLAMDRYLSARNAGNPRETEAWIAGFRSLAYAQKRPIGGKGSIRADEIIQIPRRFTRQSGSEHVNLLG